MHPQVDIYIESQIPDFQKVMRSLRQIILQAHPAIREVWKWDCAFYMHINNICYVNVRKKRIDLGFYQGVHLPDTHGALQGDGKLVKFLHFEKETDIDADLLFSLLDEAIIWDKKRYGK